MWAMGFMGGTSFLKKQGGRGARPVLGTILLLAGEESNYIVRLTVEDAAQPLHGVKRDALIVLQISDGAGVDVVFCDQRVGADIALFHRFPERGIRNHSNQALSRLLSHIIIGKNGLDYTEKCNYN